MSFRIGIHSNASMKVLPNVGQTRDRVNLPSNSNFDNDFFISFDYFSLRNWVTDTFYEKSDYKEQNRRKLFIVWPYLG